MCLCALLGAHVRVEETKTRSDMWDGQQCRASSRWFQLGLPSQACTVSMKAASWCDEVGVADAAWASIQSRLAGADEARIRIRPIP